MWIISFSIAIVSLIVAFIWGPYLLEPKLLPIVEGFFQPEFMDVAYTLKRHMESGLERGASFAVYHKGDLVLDMWTGYADRESMRRWRNVTTTLSFGCTKGVLAFVVAAMVERGLLNYSEPIATYWPEFGVHGKQRITVGMFLNHQAGLPYLSKTISLRDLDINPEVVEDTILSEQPVWAPGTEVGYHDWTFGLVMDRLIRKVDPRRRNISHIFDEEIRGTLDIEYSINLRKEDVYKTARIHSVSWIRAAYQVLTSFNYFHLYRKLLLEPNSLLSKSQSTVKEGRMPLSVFNDPELREILLSSVSGTGTARGLAKLFSILANQGSFQGQRILSPDLVDMMSSTQQESVCHVTGLPMKFSLGMQIFKNPYHENTFGQAGYGGQIVIADPKNRLSMAYLTNFLSIYRNGDDPRFLELQQAVYNCLQKYIGKKGQQEHEENIVWALHDTLHPKAAKHRIVINSWLRKSLEKSSHSDNGEWCLS